MDDESRYLEKPSITFDDVCGLKEIKDIFLERIILPLKFPQLFAGYRKYDRCMMIFGAPGTGKALYLKAAVAEVPNCSIIHRYMFDYNNTVCENPERDMRDVFTMAKRNQPCILILESFECVPTSGRVPQNEHTRRLITEIAVQINDLRDADVFVMFITQKPQDFPHVLRRRVFARVYIPLPNHANRCDMVRKFLAKTKSIKTTLTEDDVEEIALHTNGFTGSDISVLCRSCAMEPIRDLRNAKYFRRVEVQQEGVTRSRWRACAPDDTGAINMTIEDIFNAEQLDEPPVTMEHVRKNLAISNPSVSEEDLKVYHDFIRDFSDEGFFLPVMRDGAESLQVLCKKLVQKVLTLDRMDAVMKLPLPRRLKLFLLAHDDKEGHPHDRL